MPETDPEGAPDPREIVRMGYELVAGPYERNYDDEDRYRELLEPILSAVAPAGRILDLGCGCGLPVARMLAERHSITGVDISGEQIRRARLNVPRARFLCADMAEIRFDAASFDAVIALWSMIHLPLDLQPRLLDRIASWLVPGGLFLCTLGHEAWTGTEPDWLGVPGATMYWSHADAATYRAWLTAAGFEVTTERFVPEPDGQGGHQMFLARRHDTPA